LIELQALTATGFLGAAKRKSSGLDPNRLAMLVAVLEQHAQLRLADRDIFASSVGGLRVVEPASDLALLLAIAGAHHRRALDPLTAAVGEVGLGGEIRPVTQLEQRVREASRLGFKRLIVPRTARRAEAVKGIELVPAKTIDEAIEQLG
jgi:DNA repair protein RadA/Sms